MPAPQSILSHIERFDNDRQAYKSGVYNEAQVRREFLDPFFKELGWDVENEGGAAVAYRDVIHEDTLKIGETTKAPDYSFRIGGTRKFFVEAKKPSVNLDTDPRPAYQLRRYAWSASLPLSILTDFEEFLVYDCRIKPDAYDGARVARAMYLKYTEYADKWDDIAALFSREAVLAGSLDKYTELLKAKTGSSTVDADFLKEISVWREMLAQDLAARNPHLTQRDLNYAVQMTIDRIIFLRISEDRGIEPYGRLLEAQQGERVYARLCRLFEAADDRYNSGLFHFRDEKGHNEPHDELTPALTIHDDTLRRIITRLYYPDSPYAFSVMPIEILGQVYEQFLGKVIRLDESRNVEVEEKPEVRKAGGIYYTPTYIVDYIVKQTVGKLLEGKTPKQAVDFRIVDPACGSGSFLIGAYQYLLNWHRDWYVADGTQKHKKELYEASGGEWRLTTNERKRILLNNIYGVDIDPQAVEVTKLSLLLRVLEGETGQTLATQLRMFYERALPDLSSNIKCGNSLIGYDFYSATQASFLSPEEHSRINVFNWHEAFPQVFKRDSSGFDAVIGNPPYIRIQTMQEWAPVEVAHYKRRYVSASKGNYDVYVVFVEKGLYLLNKGGQLGFILPHKFFNAQYGEPLRALLAQGHHLAEVVHFGDQQVFSGATTYTCLLFLEKRGSSEVQIAMVENLDQWRRKSQAVYGTVPAEAIAPSDWNFYVGEGADLFGKLRQVPTKLGAIAERISQGIRTSANEVYVLNIVDQATDVLIVHSQSLGKQVEVERAAVTPFLQGREIKSYRVLPSGKVVIIPYHLANGRAKLVPEDEMKTRFPLTLAYLVANRAYLEERERGRMHGSSWYAFVYPKNIELMKSAKILVPDIADRAAFALDEAGEYAFTSGYGITLRPDVSLSPNYVLGLLNSKVLDFYLKRVSTTMRGGFFRYFTQYVEQLPMRAINFADQADKARHDHMVSLVARMVDFYRQSAVAKTPHDKTAIQRQIDAADGQINSLVYELYGLTDEEIRIVESDK